MQLPREDATTLFASRDENDRHVDRWRRQGFPRFCFEKCETMRNNASVGFDIQPHVIELTGGRWLRHAGSVQKTVHWLVAARRASPGAQLWQAWNFVSEKESEGFQRTRRGDDLWRLRFYRQSANVLLLCWARGPSCSNSYLWCTCQAL